MVTDPVTGESSQSEYYAGLEKIKNKEEQMYLGDVIAPNWRHFKNLMNRKKKGLSIINQIIEILQATSYGKYYCEVALVLRESHLLSALLMNSEAWVYY